MVYNHNQSQNKTSFQQEVLYFDGVQTLLFEESGAWTPFFVAPVVEQSTLRGRQKAESFNKTRGRKLIESYAKKVKKEKKKLSFMQALQNERC